MCIFAQLNLTFMNLIEIRHQFHRLAEPSGEEFNTSAKIKELLDLHCKPNKIHTFTDSCNLLVEYDSGEPGPTLLIRGDMDAVGVEEHIALPYASENKAYAHKCGHDGHTSILLGVAEHLHLQPIKKGKVLLFFQAAEETGAGCQQLIDSGILSLYNINMVYALHNIPGLAKGSITCKADSFTCAVISCEIQLHGKTSHAAEPEKGISPFNCARSIAEQMLAWSNSDLHSDNYQIVTLVELHIGETAYGVAAGDGVLRLTIRTKTEQQLQELKGRTEELVASETPKTAGISHSIRWLEYFAGGQNDASAVEIVKKSAEQCGLTYVEKEVPFTWGEDFGLLTQHYAGALFGLGCGTDCPALHHQDYDFPDDILSDGVNIFCSILDLSNY